MFITPRRQKNLRKKLSVYFLLPGILIGIFFLLNLYFNFGKPLFISPLGKTNTDLSLVEKTLREKKITYSGVVWDNGVYLVSIQNSGQVKLDKDKDIYNQVSSLQKILIQLTIEGKSFRSIDFRFAEPIVSY